MSVIPLYFCPECHHIFYHFPPNGICTICGNEISQEDIVEEEDILKCETCHSIYLPQMPNEIIPAANLNEKYLCACKNNCPTQSVLQIQKDKSYVGNIILAQIVQCSNCKAIFFRGFEERHKDCTVCHSPHVNTIDFDSQTQKIFFKCANPKHQIRLKYRDIIIANNKGTEQILYHIRQKEEKLHQDYLQKRAEIESRPKGFLGRSITVINQALWELDSWAGQQRFLLYDLPSQPARCVVYRSDTEKAHVFEKIEGCDAIAEISIRKTVDSDSKSTQIKRRIVAQSPPLVNQSHLSPQNTSFGDIGVQKTIAPDNLQGFVSNEINNVPTTISPKEKIVRRPSLLDQIIIHSKWDAEKTEIKEAAANFSNITTDPITFLIKIRLDAQFSNDQPLKYIPVNYGIIPVDLSKEGKVFRFGRQHLLEGFWYNPDFFIKNPYLFDNIISSDTKSCQFKLKWEGGNLMLYPGENSYNNNILKMKSGETIEKFPAKLAEIDNLSLYVVYALSKENINNPHKYIFKFTFDIPNNIEKIFAEG